jgi:hypothetical protein
MMTARDIASLSVKLFGIYAFFQAVPMLPSVAGGLGMLTMEEGSLSGLSFIFALLYVLPFFLLIAGGILLLLYADSIGASLTTRMTGNGEPHISAMDVQAIAFSAIGVFAIVAAAPKILQIAANLYFTHTSEEARAVGVRVLPQVVGLVAQTIVGVGLFIGARGLAKLWRRVRGNSEMGDL